MSRITAVQTLFEFYQFFLKKLSLFDRQWNQNVLLNIVWRLFGYEPLFDYWDTSDFVVYCLGGKK